MSSQISETLHCGNMSTWRLLTSGTDWDGLLVLERSYDGGVTWLQVRSFRHKDGEANFNVYAEEDEQCLLRIRMAEYNSGTVTATLSSDPYVNVGYMKITEVINSRNAIAVIDPDTPLANTAASNMWYEAAWSDVQGYPAAVTFWEDRLMWAGTVGSPRGVWLSKPADYYNFATSSPKSEDDDSIQVTLTSRKMSMIHSLVTLRQSVMAFSEDGVNTISYSTSSLTPTSIMQRAESYYGARQLDPLVVGSQVIYVQEVGGAVRDIGYDYVQDAYSGDEISLWSSSLVNESVPVEMTYQQEPDSIVWIAREDGMLLSLTYLREQEMAAWAHHTTQGEIESVCTIPYNNKSRLWLAVKRTVNGQTVRYIERMSNRLPSDNSAEQLYMDAASTYDGEPTNTMSAPQLAGCLVKVMVDGNILPDQMVRPDGTINLPRTGRQIAIGLGYISRLETLNVEIQGLMRGVMQGHKIKVGEVILRLLKSRGGRVGQVDGSLDEWQRRQRTDYLGEALDLFTGDAFVNASFSTDYGGRVIVEQDTPQPFTLLGLIMAITVSDA